jgi:hypothetical protein
MTVRVDSAPLIAGAIVVGQYAVGVTAAQISTLPGRQPSVLAGPAEANAPGDVYRAEITAKPSGFYMWEDGSYIANAPGQVDYRVYRNGSLLGTFSQQVGSATTTVKPLVWDGFEILEMRVSDTIPESLKGLFS